MKKFALKRGGSLQCARDRFGRRSTLVSFGVGGPGEKVDELLVVFADGGCDDGGLADGEAVSGFQGDFCRSGRGGLEAGREIPVHETLLTLSDATAGTSLVNPSACHLILHRRDVPRGRRAAVSPRRLPHFTAEEGHGLERSLSPRLRAFIPSEAACVRCRWRRRGRGGRRRRP